MPYTRTVKGWSDGALQPNNGTNQGNDTRRHASFCQADTAPGKSVAQAKNASQTDFSHSAHAVVTNLHTDDLLERLTDATDAQLEDEAWLRETRIAIADRFFSAWDLGLRRWWFSGWHGWQTIEHAPDWLHSVDAALTLLANLREHWYIEHISDNRWLGDGSGYRVKLWRPTEHRMVTAHADTLPVAICIACLRASVGEGR